MMFADPCSLSQVCHHRRSCLSRSTARCPPRCSLLAIARGFSHHPPWTSLPSAWTTELFAAPTKSPKPSSLVLEWFGRQRPQAEPWQMRMHPIQPVTPRRPLAGGLRQAGQSATTNALPCSVPPPRIFAFENTGRLQSFSPVGHRRTPPAGQPLPCRRLNSPRKGPDQPPEAPSPASHDTMSGSLRSPQTDHPRHGRPRFDGHMEQLGEREKLRTQFGNDSAPPQFVH